MSNDIANLTELLQLDPYALEASEKLSRLLPIYKSLHEYHRKHCLPYANITDESKKSEWAALDDVPYLAVRLFKLYQLSSINPDDVFKVVYSSGTSGQTPSRIFLDRHTTALQSKCLVKILQSYLGKQRLPMLIIDTQSVLKKDGSYSARAAGIQGLSMFARETCFVLDDDMQLNMDRLNEFSRKYKGKPVLIFGFTFMVWKYLLQFLSAKNQTVDLSQGILLHSGGWKKLESEKVDNLAFKKTIADTLSVTNVHNFYGMAEQTGTIFVECEEGHLHTPNMADVLIRDPASLDIVETGKIGLIQVLSILPKSYPGYSLLTEDLGRCLGEDDCPCGRKGKYFEVLGRLPKTELRGCSDTHVV